MKTISGALAGLCLLALAACDNGASAVESRDRSGGEVAVAEQLTDQGAAAAPAAEAKPVITTARDETVDDKVRRLHERNGAAFGANSAADYLTKANAFIGSPPAGTETVKRPNGDTLYYQASTNTFAVADRNGVLRTMFKPDNGAAYWTEQKERAPNFGRSRNNSSAS